MARECRVDGVVQSAFGILALAVHTAGAVVLLVGVVAIHRQVVTDRDTAGVESQQA
ncbi:hypothetical protein [Haloarcula marina]|uniref:hypothetical protein n=1 Tax=Haloarcula marina TaxID=2961574 RepID=UPI0020B73CE1|nr:hypothetical protein [Halomicroarcula marina]